MADPAATSEKSPQNAVLAACWVLGTAASFILMMIAVRELSTNMSSFELLSFRSLIGIPIMCLVAWRLGFDKVKTRRIGMQVSRNQMWRRGAETIQTGIYRSESGMHTTHPRPRPSHLSGLAL